jgi:hypothetical protein
MESAGLSSMHWLRQEPGNHACQKNRHALGVWGDGGSVAVLKFDRGLVCPVRNAGHIVTAQPIFKIFLALSQLNTERGLEAQALKQTSRSNLQFGPIS